MGHSFTQEQAVELPCGLGAFYWNQQPPGAVVLDDHGEPYRPGLGAAQVAIIEGKPHRHIFVRWPFTDLRAEDMLADEAKQLSTDTPGVVMIQVSGAVGAILG